MIREPFEYDHIFYNEVVSYLETKWKRKLTEHERNTLIEGYRFGRLVESANKERLIAELKKADQFSEELERKYMAAKWPEVEASINAYVTKKRRERSGNEKA